MAMRLSLEEDRVEETHEINVTPFIDVILVLLIIFMVAAPRSTVDVNVDLPSSTAQPAPRPEKPVFLTVKADLSLALGDDPVGRGNLAGPRCRDARRQGVTRLRSSRPRGPWRGHGVMNLLRGAGHLKIGLVGMEAAPATRCNAEPPRRRSQIPETKPAEMKP
jgi:biopolymer transport protein ExbD